MHGEARRDSEPPATAAVAASISHGSNKAPWFASGSRAWALSCHGHDPPSSPPRSCLLPSLPPLLARSLACALSESLALAFPRSRPPSLAPSLARALPRTHARHGTARTHARQHARTAARTHTRKHARQHTRAAHAGACNRDKPCPRTPNAEQSTTTKQAHCKVQKQCRVAVGGRESLEVC